MELINESEYESAENGRTLRPNFSLNSAVSQPNRLKETLYTHQLKSIYKMERLEDTHLVVINNNNYKRTSLGILSDLDGYGKSLTMLGLICRDTMDWNLTTMYNCEYINNDNAGLILNCSSRSYKRLDCNLILVPKYLIKQWEDEINKTNLSYFVFQKKNDVKEIKAENYDIVLTSPEFYNTIVQLYINCAWKRFIIDEPAHIKISGMRTVQAGFIWLISGNPSSIFSTHQKSRNNFMRDIIGDNYNMWQNNLQYLIIKNDDEYFKYIFSVPKPTYIRYKCYNELFEIIYPSKSEDIIDLIEDDNIKDAVKALGGTECSDIYEFVRKKKDKEILQVLIQIEEAQYNNDNINTSQIIELKQQEERLTNQSLNINERIDEMLTSSCSICCKTITKPIIEVNCENIFCGYCFLTWYQIKDKCPLCRATITPKNITYISEKNDTHMKGAIVPNKSNTTLDIIRNNAKGKFIVFSNDGCAYENMKIILSAYRIECQSLKGNNVNDYIERYKTGKLSVLFLNNSSIAVGLNLIQTTDIIIYHKLRSDVQSNLENIALSVQRTTPLNVHLLQI